MSVTIHQQPSTVIEPVIDVVHGVEIPDPYRWLEDQDTPRTREWIEEQTTYTRAYFDAIPNRDRIRNRIAELLSTESASLPWTVSDQYFFEKRLAGREQACILMRDGLFGPQKILVDPALRNSGLNAAVSITAISQDGRYLAYSVRLAGTESSSIEILDLERMVALPDGLPEGMCCGLSFAADHSGFYYSHRTTSGPRPNRRAVLFHRYGED